MGMQFDEAAYIQRINEMQAQIDEDDKLIEDAYLKIEELKLRLSLADSSHSKKGASQRQVKAYEDKIAELEQCVSLFTSSDLSAKADEIDTFLKRVISINKQVEDLSKSKRVKDKVVCDIEETITNLSADLVTRFLELLQAIKTLENHDDKTNSAVSEYVNRVNSSLGVVHKILESKENEVIRARRELKKLKESLISQTGSADTVDSLKAKLAEKDREIDAYKTEIQALRFKLEQK